MGSYRIQGQGSGRGALRRRSGVVEPLTANGGHGTTPAEQESVSRMIAGLNEHFGLDFSPEHRVTLAEMMERVDADDPLEAAREHNRERAGCLR
ncbi:hypothetical protein [Tepidiforma sp.]|uniref:hypothetical protein n=1 Tax=Tepidiforma sp. TaxID=2682230 RepID=UPI002ADDA396|nr:hypothetical protein [Tepidiforma sp.]